MKRKLGHLMNAAVFALPFALPGVALAQSAGDTATPSTQQDTGKGMLDQNNNANQGASGMSAGSHDEDKNMGNQEGTTGTGADSQRNPPAGELDKSGSQQRDTKSGDSANTDDSASGKYKRLKKSVRHSMGSEGDSGDTKK